MNALVLVRLVVALLSKGLPLPDMKNQEAVEQWLTGLTPAVAALIVALAGRANIVGEELPLPTHHDLQEVATECCIEQNVEMDPATIIAIVTLVMEMIKLWRNR